MNGSYKYEFLREEYEYWGIWLSKTKLKYFSPLGSLGVLLKEEIYWMLKQKYSSSMPYSSQLVCLRF